MNTVRINTVVAIEEHPDGVFQITLEDRKNKNMFTTEIIEGLMSAYSYIDECPECKVVIVTGFDSYFSSGGTKESLLSLNETRGNFSDANIYSLALECSVPVISAMQGHGIGGGLVMGLFSDIVILSKESYYTLNFMKYGFTPGMGSTLIVPKKLGINLGNEMLLSANQYRGDDLEKRGIAFEVLPRKQVLSRAHELAEMMAQKPVESLRLLKQHLSREIRTLLPQFVEQELVMHSKTMHQPEVAQKIEQLFGNPESKPVDEKIKDMLLALKNKEISSVEARKLIVNVEANSTESDVKHDKNAVVGKHVLQKPSSTDIAIISAAGRFPASENVDEYWENIRQGKDCISDIPGDRHLADEAADAVVECRWGGFISDVDKFDPLFFKISPREAQLMDPQERLLLEEVWKLLENIGYTRKKIAKDYDKKVAVYTASMYQQYHAFNTDQDKKAMVSMSSLSSMANRISHFFDFQGPSMAVDTMCSATTAAVHLACRSLISGESRLAVVGAANLSIHPYKYQALTQSQLLTSQREARGFGGSGGFIPAETVGAVLLKPLAEAVSDGDSILAIIKGTSVSHKGNTDGFSVSNPEALASLFRDCIRSAGLKPEEIDYVETSVAGAEVSDIAEMKALKDVFSEVNSAEKIPVGTVKSSIGHAEAASGLTQLIKVAMQLKHRVLVPTINHKPVNPNLKLEGSIFRIQDTLQPWEIADRQRPRRAIINTLGAGGTSSCLLLEEYVPQNDSADRQLGDHQQASADRPRIIMFSAKTEDRLREYVQRNLNYLENAQGLNFDHVAYTLHEGREPMPVRLGCVVSTLSELSDRLKSWLDGQYEQNTFFNDLENESPGVMQTSEVSENRELAGMAKQWVLGEELTWSSVYPDDEDCQLREIIPLPNYPFIRRHCWLPNTHKRDKNNVSLAVKTENTESFMDSAATATNSSLNNAIYAEPSQAIEKGELASITSISKKSNAINLEQQVIKAISEILGLLASEINKTTPLKDLGVTSVTKMLIISAICENIDDLDESHVGTALAQLDTVESIVSHIEGVLESKTELDYQGYIPEKTHVPKSDIAPLISNVARMSGANQVAQEIHEKPPEYLSFSKPSYMDKYISGGYRFTYKNSPLSTIKDIDNKSTVVIGAGPAGIMAALSVLQAGCEKVFVFDKREAVDRMQMVTIYKNTLPYLKRFGVLKKILDRGSPITNHSFYFAGGGSSKKYYETKIDNDLFDGDHVEPGEKQSENVFDEFTGESVLAISLSDLQDVLLREAIDRGVNIFFGVDAEVCRETGKEQFSVKLNYKPDDKAKAESATIVPGLIVIGDGAYSKNAKNIGINYSIEDTSKAEETWYIYHSKTTGNTPTLNYKFTFDQGEQLSGCEFGLFYPCRSELGVATYTAEGKVPKLGELAKRAEFFAHTQDASIQKVMWVSKPIHVKFVRANTFSIGNAILIGDAAGVGSPIAGMGAVLAVSAYASAIEKYFKLRNTDPDLAAREYNENASSYVDAWQNRSRYIWSQIDRLPDLEMHMETEN